MPAFIYANCRCGRTLRARVDQAGTAIRCWSCGGNVTVPHPRVTGRLAWALAESVPRSLSLPTVVAVLAVAVLISAALVVPVAGLWLALGVCVAAAWWYGRSIRESGLAAWGRLLPPRAAGGDASGAADGTPGPGLLARVWWLVLSVLSVAALVAPLAIRNGGGALPEVGDPFPPPGARVWAAVALLGWLVMPLLLVTTFAHDRRGRLSPVAALAALVRHPAATLAALLILPLGLLVMEGLIASAAWQQGSLPLLVSDLYPPPQFVSRQNGAHLVFNYDGIVKDRLFLQFSEEASSVYWLGMRRGYTLTGTLPASLTTGITARMSPELFRTTEEIYFGVRFFLSVLILTGTGLLLAIQSRWLGVTASLGSRRKGLLSGAYPALAAAPPATAGQTAGSGAYPVPAAALSSSSGAGLHPVPTPAQSATFTHPGPAQPLPTFTVPGPVAAQARVPGVGPTQPQPQAHAPGQAPITIAAAGNSVAAPFATPAPAHLGYPNAATAPAQAPSPNGANGSSLPASARPLILLIEDELAVADAVARILVSKGYGVMIAVDGEEGLRQARSARPDLIVLDLLLPTMLGMEVCRELRAGDITRRIPVVMATCADTDTDELAGLNVGADDYVAKPYSVDVLVARIQKQLHRRTV
jgi:CheY-like chemotaxis protein